MSISPNTLKYIHIFSSALCIMYISIAVKMYVLYDNKVWLFSSFLAFVAILYFYIQIFKSGHFTSEYIVIKIMSVLLAVPIGYLFFNTVLQTKHFVGLLLALATIYVLN